MAFTLSNPSGGLYIAFNSSHLPTVVQLPFWQGRVWQPLADTGKVESPTFACQLPLKAHMCSCRASAVAF